MAMSSSSQSDGPSRPLQEKRKRVLTPARREQNRLAQQALRERRRLLSSASYNDSPANSSPFTEPVENPSSSASTTHSAASSLSQRSRGFPSGSTSVEAQNEHDNAAMFTYAMLSGWALPDPPQARSVDQASGTGQSSLQELAGRLASEASSASSSSSPTSPPASSSSPSGGVSCPLQSSTYFPFARMLTPRSFSIFSALFENALALNLDIARLATCSMTFWSPFYRADINKHDAPGTLIAQAVLTLPASTPPALHPTIAQILVPHHVSLDLIPVPAFRDRAIMLGAVMPQQFDLWELKRDIYVHDALMLSLGSLDESCGAEQDRRAWEPEKWGFAPWFRRKWGLLFGSGEAIQLGVA